ncbi:MAG: 16S rRNA (uracil(1498)-N(3))-methyltransferase [Clostridia bacterium]|nr:16S rRNA (uracil(1498)-N(3))-methyltransferase [Clostridia bacterium]
MFNFFIKDGFNGDTVTIEGNDYNHIKNVLRMKEGEDLLISHDGKSSLCSIKEFLDGAVVLSVIKKDYAVTSLPVEIALFQGLPKNDKLELIIQKAVELGVSKIIPVETERAIVKIEEKKKQSKTARWQSIAESAAKQCKLTFIPEVLCPVTFNSAIELINSFDHFIVPYENKDGMTATVNALKEIKAGQKVGIFIGPEGGISEKEITALENVGAKPVSLGKRILRTETAAIIALSMLMLYAEINL